MPGYASSRARSGLVSIVTPTRDRPDMIDRLLRSIGIQTYKDIEVIIVDDGSTPPLVLGNPAIRVIRHESSLGFCLANNAGFAHANGEFLLLLNDDAELADETVVERAVRIAMEHPNAGAIAFAQLRPSRELHTIQPAQATELSSVDRFLGYGCLLRKPIIDRIGGFNPIFGAYHEDIEMSLRIVQSGFLILYDPALRVVHYEDTRHRDYRRIHRLSSKNAMLTALLRYPWFCVPAAALSYSLNFSRMSRHSGNLDLSGFGWIAFEVFRQWRYLLRERNPMRYATFKEVRALRATPVSVHGLAPAPSHAV